MSFSIIDLSKRERGIWVELVVDILVLAYYLPKAWALMKLGETALLGAAMGELITSTIVYAIVLGIVVAVLVEVFFADGREKDGLPRDERDYQFELRSYRFGYYALMLFVVLIISQQVVVVLLPWAAERMPFEFTSLIIAHFLLLALSFASLIQCGTRLFYYRRGY